MSDDGLGGLASLTEVEQAISDSFDELGNVATTVGDIPSTASIRPSGSFTDAESCKEYLDRGGLLVVDSSENVEPIGFVWLLMEFDLVLEEYVWTVYIDDDTN
ncbi:MAG: hypothetical protein V3S69_08035 [Dehalococcoidales bacterium]